MDVFITDLAKIHKKSLFLKDKISQLLPKDKDRFERIKDSKHKWQFLMGRLMIYRFLGTDFEVEKSGKLVSEKKYLSLAHSKNLVVLALSDLPVGIDVEYTPKKREYQKICQFLHLGKCSNKQDFYKLFTQYEADYKLGKTSQKIEHNFFMWKKYLICVAGLKKVELEQVMYWNP